MWRNTEVGARLSIRIAIVLLVLLSSAMSSAEISAQEPERPSPVRVEIVASLAGSLHQGGLDEYFALDARTVGVRGAYYPAAWIGPWVGASLASLSVGCPHGFLTSEGPRPCPDGSPVIAAGGVLRHGVGGRLLLEGGAGLGATLQDEGGGRRVSVTFGTAGVAVGW